MPYTQQELDMARKGYVYHAKVEGNVAFRKRATKIERLPRADIIFDWPAYECHTGETYDPR